MIYSAIDFGSDTIKIVVGKVMNEEVNILAATNVRSIGIKRGMIVNKEMVCESINLAQKEIEKQLGFKIDKAIINVPFYEVETNLYNGRSYPDGEITGVDVINSFKSCVSTIDVDLEVITVFPIDFTIDNERKVLDPKGDFGHQLDCRILISTIPKGYLYSFLEVLEKCQIEVIDLSFNVINDFYNLNRIEYQKGCGAIVDIGNDKTEIGIFNKGLMINGTVLMMGSKLIDNDINYIYHLDKATIRNIKEEFAYSSSQYSTKDEKIEFTNLDGSVKKINQLEISEIVEARVLEILKNVKKTINDLTKHEISYIIISGGITNSLGFDYVLENIFNDKGSIINLNVIGAKNNIYTSCVGMIKYYYDKLRLRGIDYTMYDSQREISKEEKALIHDNLIEGVKKYLEDN